MDNGNEEIVSMNEVMDKVDENMKKIQVGDLIKGKVISVTDNKVLVNIGYISDGIIERDLSVTGQTYLFPCGTNGELKEIGCIISSFTGIVKKSDSSRLLTISSKVSEAEIVFCIISTSTFFINSSLGV